MKKTEYKLTKNQANWDAKVPLIKEIRRRYSDNSGKCIGLKEAKYLADSIFRDLGW